jgi:non-specific protein-tyrosine kinase
LNDTFETPSFSDDLRRHIGLLWHWGWLIILSVVLAGGAAFLISQQMTPIYQASATMLINQAPSQNSSEYAALLTSQRLAETYAQMLTTQPILEGVTQSLGLNISTERLKSQISVQLIRDTQLIQVSVEHTDPTWASRIANEVVINFAEYNKNFQASRYADTEASLAAQLDELNERIQETNQTLQAMDDDPEQELERNKLETTLSQNQALFASLLQTYESVRLAKAESTSDVILVEPAFPPERPVRPKVLQNTLLAAVVGGMLAVGLIFLIDALDNTIKGPDDVARHLGLPVLGMIARDEATKEDDSLITISQPRSPISEAYRALRTNIQFASVDKPIQSLVVTSIAPAEGKTTVAANLSITLSQGGRNVIVIDADLRRPKMHQKMNLPNRKGLTSLFMQADLHLDGTIQKTKTNNLYVMTTGNLPPNPSELLASDRMDHILDKMLDNADIILIDTPPIMAVTDAVILSQRVDGLLLVIKVGETKTVAAQQTVSQLRRLNANILGVVLNSVPTRGSRYYYSNGYYSYQEYYGKLDRKDRKGLFRKRAKK